MAAISSSKVLPCRWDWCRSTFTSIDDLDTHVKHQHVWPMKPMRKSEIALMRRMDLQSLHSSLDTDSSIFPGESIPVPSQDTRQSLAATTQSLSVPLPSTPPRRRRAESEDFNTFEQLSSPIQAASPRLPASPALEGLVRQGAWSGLTAAVEKFERTRGHKANQHLLLPSQQHSPTQTPPSQSSVSSQYVVEQQLTQEDDVDISMHRDILVPPSNSQQSEVTEAELQWPDDEASESSQSRIVLGRTRIMEQPVSSQSRRPGSSQGSTRGQHFRSGSLAISLGGNDDDAGPSKSHCSPARSTQRSHSPSQPFALQTQAPYLSQTIDWSQSQ